jgi:carboxymethylenebutenolidase
MRGYLVQPNAQGPFPALLVIHENRGLNPYLAGSTSSEPGP